STVRPEDRPLRASRLLGVRYQRRTQTSTYTGALIFCTAPYLLLHRYVRGALWSRHSRRIVLISLFRVRVLPRQARGNRLVAGTRGSVLICLIQRSGVISDWLQSARGRLKCPLVKSRRLSLAVICRDLTESIESVEEPPRRRTQPRSIADRAGEAKGDSWLVCEDFDTYRAPREVAPA